MDRRIWTDIQIQTSSQQQQGGKSSWTHICGDGGLRRPGQEKDLPHPLGSLQGQPYTNGRLETFHELNLV